MIRKTMKYIVIAAVIIMVTGCATTKISPAQSSVDKDITATNGQNTRKTTIRIGDCQ